MLNEQQDQDRWHGIERMTAGFSENNPWVGTSQPGTHRNMQNAEDNTDRAEQNQSPDNTPQVSADHQRPDTTCQKPDVDEQGQSLTLRTMSIRLTGPPMKDPRTPKAMMLAYRPASRQGARR